MTEDQIKKYEYCKNHLAEIERWKEKIPFGFQKYGCGTGRPNIEYSLEKMHNEMYTNVIEAINEAKGKIELMIESI